jgi:hypothetical protein
MRRARLEDRHIDRWPLEIDRVAVLRDRNRGNSLTDIARITTYPAPPSVVLLKLARETQPLAM